MHYDFRLVRLMFFDVLAIFLCVGVVLVNGFTDAPSVVATAVCTGAIRLKNALWLCAICNFLGVLLAYLLGSKIARFVFSLSGANSSKIACATLLCVVIFGILAWLFGLPSSESHALLCSLAGASFFTSNSLLGLKKVGYVFVFMIISNIFAFLCSILISRLLKRELHYNRLQACSCGLNALMHGWQDGQKLVGIAIAVLHTNGAVPLYLPLTVGVILALGTLLGGRKIIKTLGHDLVSLEQGSALCSDLGAYASLFVFSIFGVPLSTSNVKSLAIVGAGLGYGKEINKKATSKVILTSIATFPICFLIGYCLMALLNAL